VHAAAAVTCNSVKSAITSSSSKECAIAPGQDLPLFVQVSFALLHHGSFPLIVGLFPVQLLVVEIAPPMSDEEQAEEEDLAATADLSFDDIRRVLNKPEKQVRPAAASRAGRPSRARSCASSAAGATVAGRKGAS